MLKSYKTLSSASPYEVGRVLLPFIFWAAEAQSWDLNPGLLFPNIAPFPTLPLYQKNSKLKNVTNVI